MNKKLLVNLVNAFSPSGNETEATNVWKTYCKNLSPFVLEGYSDKMGNLAYKLGSGPKKILLSAHIDEVQCRVSYISDTGMISMINTGGMCKKSLVGSEVVILGKKGPVVGIVEKKAIHCEEDDERRTVCGINKMKINIGAETKDEALKAGVYPGACVVYQRRCFPDFGANQICATGLDDKSGLYVVGRILEELIKRSPWSSTNPEWYTDDYTVYFLAATQEETGLRGATVAARAINPDISIDFDVTFSTDGDIDLEKTEYGDVVLGKGGVIEYGPDKSLRIADILIEQCDKHKISYQQSTSGAGGTNTDVFQLVPKNCETMLVSIPNRSMHTPVEVCDWRDMESIVSMVVYSILEKKL